MDFPLVILPVIADLFIYFNSCALWGAEICGLGFPGSDKTPLSHMLGELQHVSCRETSTDFLILQEPSEGGLQLVLKPILDPMSVQGGGEAIARKPISIRSSLSALLVNLFHSSQLLGASSSRGCLRMEGTLSGFANAGYLLNLLTGYLSF